jgi:ABC-type uncharacterized transport system substrate-binding protein
MQMRLLAFAFLSAHPATAHPHVFVTATLNITLDDDGQMQGLHVTWAYDDLFSLLVTEELQLDPDGDMVLTPDETAALTAYIIDWPADYVGDVYLWAGEVALPLAPVTDHAVSFQDGIVSETFYRALITPKDTITAPVDVQVYDPYYYVAYETLPEITLSGRQDCTATLTRADIASADAMVQTMLNGRPASDVGVDEQFPQVGRAFADTVRVACGG